MDQKILREYLVSLGFRTDPVSMKRFDWVLGTLDKRIMTIGKGMLGVAAAAQGMVLAFSNSMEKAFYASKLGQSTIANMQAAAFAGRQIGLSTEQVNGSILNLAMALRSNPGLQAFLESFGVPVEGRDMADVMNDMVAAFGKMPTFLGMQFAEMFGMDPQTFILMRDNLAKYNEELARRKDLARQAGVNEDEAAQAALRYKQATRELTEKLELLGKRLSITLLPAFEWMNKHVNELVDKLLKTFNRYDTLEKIYNAPFPKDPRLQNWVEEKWNAFKDSLLPEHKRPWRPGQAGGGRGFVNPAAAGGDGGSSTFSTLEAKYGLPPGLLDRMWAKESARGKYMRSPAGALGHFGFMPGTAKEWGVDPNDLASSSEGAARYMAHLMKRYGGDLPTALAAYNWGMGNVDRYGLGSAPAETRDYMRMAEGLTVQGPQTTINIYGADDPQRTADEVAQRLERRDADYMRNMTTVIR